MTEILTPEKKKVWNSPIKVESLWGKPKQEKLNVKNNPTTKKANKSK